MEEIVQMVDEFVNDVKKDYVNLLAGKNYVISKKVTTFTKLEENKVGGYFSLPYYYVFIDHGRRPGKMPPIGKIKGWVIYKGITPNNHKMTASQLAFVIARAIGQRGVKGKYLLSEALGKNLAKIDEIKRNIAVKTITTLTFALKK